MGNHKLTELNFQQKCGKKFSVTNLFPKTAKSTQKPPCQARRLLEFTSQPIGAHHAEVSPQFSPKSTKRSRLKKISRLFSFPQTLTRPLVSLTMASSHG